MPTPVMTIRMDNLKTGSSDGPAALAMQTIPTPSTRVAHTAITTGGVLTVRFGKPSEDW